MITKNRIFYILLFLSFFISACAQTPNSYIAEGQSCNLDLYAHDLEVALPFREDPLDGLNYNEAQERAITQDRSPLLFLSGGSENGAFGAGYLSEWSKLKNGLPEFSLVTGVSTGALQSTAAFTNHPELAVDVAAIISEADILETYVDGSELRGGLGLDAAMTLLRRGSISDLIPLRNRLSNTISENLLLEVASGADKGRKLYVGVTDVDTGSAVAMDMTVLAQLYRDNPALRNTYKSCYIEILIASSVVPVAAKPVFIDNRMYIDGGLRFGVFTEQIGPLLASRNEPAPGSPVLETSVPSTPIHIILNGDGIPSRNCGKEDEYCNGDRPIDISQGAHKDWTFPGLALRAVDLLSNQVSRLSLDRAISLNRDFESDVRFAHIKEDERDVFEMSSDLLSEALKPDQPQTLTCREWRSIDKSGMDKNGTSQATPVEFHPRYMHCLTAYGRAVAYHDFQAGNL